MQLLLDKVVFEDRLLEKTRLRNLLRKREGDIVPKAEHTFRYGRRIYKRFPRGSGVVVWKFESELRIEASNVPGKCEGLEPVEFLG